MNISSESGMTIFLRIQTFPYLLSAQQGRICYHFYNVFGIARSEIEPKTSRSRGERFTAETPLRLLPLITI